MELSSNVQTDTEVRLCRELVGRTIRLVEIDDPYTSLKPGDIGVITDVCELSFSDTPIQLWVNWNTEPPSRLCLLDGKDRYEFVDSS